MMLSTFLSVSSFNNRTFLYVVVERLSKLLRVISAGINSLAADLRCSRVVAGLGWVTRWRKYIRTESRTNKPRPTSTSTVAVAIHLIRMAGSGTWLFVVTAFGAPFSDPLTDSIKGGHRAATGAPAFRECLAVFGTQLPTSTAPDHKGNTHATV
jgi:hypothetical protein